MQAFGRVLDVLLAHPVYADEAARDQGPTSLHDGTPSHLVL